MMDFELNINHYGELDFVVGLKKFTKNIRPYLDKITIGNYIKEKYNLMIDVVGEGIVDCYKVIIEGKPKVLISLKCCSKEIENKLEKLSIKK